MHRNTKKKQNLPIDSREKAVLLEKGAECQKIGGAGGTASCRGYRGRAPKPCAAALFPQTSVALFAGIGGQLRVFRQPASFWERALKFSAANRFSNRWERKFVGGVLASGHRFHYNELQTLTCRFGAERCVERYSLHRKGGRKAWRVPPPARDSFKGFCGCAAFCWRASWWASVC